LRRRFLDENLEERQWICNSNLLRRHATVGEGVIYILRRHCRGESTKNRPEFGLFVLFKFNVVRSSLGPTVSFPLSDLRRWSSERRAACFLL